MTEQAKDQRATRPKPPFLVRRRTVFTWIVPLLLIAAVFAFHRNDGGLFAYGVGIALVALGEMIRFWAAGYISKDAVIATGGPYAHVRNPLYFGSLVLTIGYALVSGTGIWGVTILTALFLLFHLAAIAYEESTLKGDFGQPYLDYLKAVPRLIPSPMPRTTGEGQFTWERALSNREHHSALFAILLVALLSLRFLVHLTR